MQADNGTFILLYQGRETIFGQSYEYKIKNNCKFLPLLISFTQHNPWKVDSPKGASMASTGVSKINTLITLITLHLSAQTQKRCEQVRLVIGHANTMFTIVGA